MSPVHANVRPVERRDAAVWCELRCALWPEGSPAEHRAEIDQYFEGTLIEPLEVLLAIDENGTAVGLAELSIRTSAEGCATDRVGYLEGWYVRPENRRRRVGCALVAAAENWARQRGCTEFASDAEPDNAGSIAAHEALGFARVNDRVGFAKRL
ncbi:MAG TPA: GNAT family N-acetyltransferase [Vicinamibacterales bacterium]|nr:GNAT family N-acetyltransferase [Vicinamibacterales bacterium]